MQRRRLVRVPASSANLGPGFDAFAAAIALHLEVEVVETGTGAAVPERARRQAAVFTAAHGALLALGLATSDLDLIGRGLADRLHQPHRAHLYPRSADLVARARELGALGASISGAGPTVLVWC